MPPVILPSISVVMILLMPMFGTGIFSSRFLELSCFPGLKRIPYRTASPNKNLNPVGLEHANGFGPKPGTEHDVHPF